MTGSGSEQRRGFSRARPSAATAGKRAGAMAFGARALTFRACARRMSARFRARSSPSPTSHRPLATGVPMSYTPGRFVWYEHCSNDIAKARAFYEKLFDWNTELTAMPGSEPYPIIHNGDNGIGGYATTQAGAPSRWLSYLSVS